MSELYSENTPPLAVPAGKRIVLPIAIAAAGVFTVAGSAQLLSKGKLALLNISSYPVINLTYTTQFYGLVVSTLGLIFVFCYYRNSFRKFFRFGLFYPDDSASNWYTLGPAIAVAFTIGSVVMMSFGVSAQNGKMNDHFFRLLPLVFLFSATNAWTEEVISRFVLISGLYGKIKPNAICWISATIFGLPHFFGTPSGVFGVFMSGLLGWILAKSVLETRSMGWALLIHFLQDLVIFGAGAMILAGAEK